MSMNDINSKLWISARKW